MKKCFLKKALAGILSTAMIISVVSQTNLATVSAAKKNVRLNTTFKTLKVGKSYKLKLKNNTIKWKIKKVSTSDKKICTVYKKKSTSVLIKGKNVGRATIKIKIKTGKRKKFNKKTLKCRVKVAPRKSASIPEPWPEPIPEPITTYSVTFNTNGGSYISGQTVESGKTIVKPNNPTRQGYVFKGWYSDVNLENVYDFSSAVTGNITLYAKWNNTYTVKFQTNGGNTIEDQIIENGEKINRPNDPKKNGYKFEGWFIDAELTTMYNFSNELISDIILYAKWNTDFDKNIDFDIDSDGDGITDQEEMQYGSDPNKPDDTKTDTDGDGLLDYLEIYVTKTDINLVDTDGDKLTDYQEVTFTNTNPLLIDTNIDGVNDYESDEDKDGLNNGIEISINTNPIKTDTDGDGLTDKEEYEDYKTDPNKIDTDGDGADDKWEIDNNYDPLIYNESFHVVEEFYDNNSIIASVELEYGGDPTSISIEETTEAGLLNESTPGYIGGAFSFSSDNKFESAEISFKFDPQKLNEGAEPTIYYFDEETQLLEPLSTTITENIASAKVKHFSTYILLDRKAVDKVWDNEILPPENESNSDSILDIVFVIDYSASMNDNDPEYSRLEIVKKFINKLRNNRDRASIVKFAAYATTLVPLTSDKEMLTNAVSSITNASSDGCSDSEAGTNGTDGIYHALRQLENSNGTKKSVIFLTDGEDTTSNYNYEELINESKEKNITIFSIGMGDADKEQLANIAESTGGKFYFANTVNLEETTEGSLIDAFTEIENITIDRELDSNNDGISDYYTRLICEGKLRTGTGMALFDNVSYEIIQSNQDYDEDGVINGEEIIITQDEKTGKIYIIVLSSPSVKDTDGDGIIDKNDTSPKEKGLAHGIVGALKICSYGSGENSSGGISGHAFVAYTSYINDEITLYGILVDSEDNCAKKNDTRSDRAKYHQLSVKSNSVITIGGWAEWLPDELKGSWINNELMILEHAVNSDQYSLTAYLTENDVKRMELCTKNNNKWTYFYNCSAYAVDLWNYATKDNLSAKGIWASPSSLKYNMKKRGNYKIAEKLLADLP